MKPLDVISSVDFGYRLIWAERRYLVRLAVVPVAMQLLLQGIVVLLGWQLEFLRSAIITIPALFAYGWMFSHLSRLIFWGQRWPFRPSGNAVADGIMLQDRAHGISAGTLFFVITGYLLSGINAIALMALSDSKVQMAASAQAMQEPNALAGLAAFAFLVFFLWSVRFMFLYIPAAAGLSVRPLVMTSQGMLISLQMVGIVLVCCIPVLLVAKWVFVGVLSVAATGEDLSTGLIIFGTIWMSLASVLAQLIVTAAIAFGIKTMMSEKGKS